MLRLSERGGRLLQRVESPLACSREGESEVAAKEMLCQVAIWLSWTVLHLGIVLPRSNVSQGKSVLSVPLAMMHIVLKDVFQHFPEHLSKHHFTQILVAYYRLPVLTF
jgi:hypothetical protein